MENVHTRPDFPNFALPLNNLAIIKRPDADVIILFTIVSKFHLTLANITKCRQMSPNNGKHHLTLPNVSYCDHSNPKSNLGCQTNLPAQCKGGEVFNNINIQLIVGTIALLSEAQCNFQGNLPAFYCIVLGFQ